MSKRSELKELEKLEITMRRVSKPREKWGTFSSVKELLDSIPLEEEASWQLIIKANKGYGANHKTGMTCMSNWRGKLETDHVIWTVNAALAGYEL